MMIVSTEKNNEINSKKIHGWSILLTIHHTFISSNTSREAVTLVPKIAV